MKRLLHVTILLALVLGVWMPTTARAQEDSGDTVNVLLQTSGSVEALIAKIVSLGGTVSIRYENVTAIAASIPADQLAAVANFSGVSKIEKDKIVNLFDETEAGNGRHPLSFEVEDVEGVGIESLAPASIDLEAIPDGYFNFTFTGASAVWGETGFGEGTIVAVVDTGTVRNACLSHAVVGAPGFPEGFNASGDGIPATDPRNHWHGTHVGGVIASSCFLDFTGNPEHPIYQAVHAYLPWPENFVPIFGQAPLAQLYPVKVFPASGAGVPSSVVMAGLDHVLTLKTSGDLDVDIVNMSLGGPTLFDGMDLFDTFVAELEAADVLVVSAAGNDGPIPNTVGSPATAMNSIKAGALDLATSSRVLYEYLGLRFGLGAGQGLVMRPEDETRVVNFSARGPLSDSRAGPDMVALGLWNFHAGPRNELRWAGGTSFSSPTIAGGAALLNAWLEVTGGEETNPALLRSALVLGANDIEVGSAWSGVNDQGYGSLDLPASLLSVQQGDIVPVIRYIGSLQPNVLGVPRRGATETFTSDLMTLGASEKVDFVFRANMYTSQIKIEITDVDVLDNLATSFFGDALEVNVQTAKRTAFGQAYYNLLQAGTTSLTLDVRDGPWTASVNGGAAATVRNQPMEPGLWKVTLAGDFVNEQPVSFRVKLTRANLRIPLTAPKSQGIIEPGDSFVIPVVIPAGMSKATFDLEWRRKWDSFPTSDIDMLIFNPSSVLVSTAGATGNAPERATINSPVAGTWFVLIDAFEMYRPDFYRLFLTLTP